MQVIILAAGDQTRMCGSALPKVLLPYKGKAVLSHIVEAWLKMFSKDDLEFVVAIREQDKIIVDYCNVALPRDTKLKVVVVPEYNRAFGPVGTLYYVLSQLPYSGSVAFTVGDGVYTLPLDFTELGIPFCLFVDDKGGSADYLHIGVNYQDKYLRIFDKVDKFKESTQVKSWSGVAWFQRREDLVNLVSTELSSSEPNVEVSFASVLSFLPKDDTRLVKMPFVDLGTREKYEQHVPASSVYDKLHQVTYASQPRVVKIFPTQEDACGFFARIVALKNSGARWVTPDGLVRSHNVVGYDWVDGVTVGSVAPYQFANLLTHLERQLWGTPVVGPSVSSHLMFDKAKARVHEYLSRTGRDVNQDPLLNSIRKHGEDTVLTEALVTAPVCPIHGDLTLDNIIAVSQDLVSFRLIDFRPNVNFKSAWVAEGDLHYDLAKLWVSLNIDIPKIKRGTWTPSEPLPEPLFSIENKEVMSLWCGPRRISYYAVERLGGLLIAAMCGVHTDPLDTALYQKALSILGENYEA